MRCREPAVRPMRRSICSATSCSDLTPSKFLRACVEENDRYMAAFDPRLLRPRVIPTLGRFALAVFDAIAFVRSALLVPNRDGRRISHR